MCFHALNFRLAHKLKRSSAQANRASVVEESAKAKITAREAARLERQRKLAETLRIKADAEERGEDVERQKNWEYTIEENDEWEKKKARKNRRADFEFHGMYPLSLGCVLVHATFSCPNAFPSDDAHAARRRYKKDLDVINPDLAAYNKQKEIALGLAPGTLSKGGSSISNFNPTGGPSSSQVSHAATSSLLFTSDWRRSLCQHRNSSNSRRKVYTVTLTPSYMRITSPLKMLLTELSVRSIESTHSLPFPLLCLY